MAKGRKKPMMGAKKYDRLPLKCTVKGCDNEFFTSKASTPARRWCEEHWFAGHEVKTSTEQILAALGMLR